MKAAKKRIFTLLLCLCICLSICSVAPVSASAEGEISKILTTISDTPVTMNAVYSISAATSTEGCYISSYGWYDGSTAIDGTFGTGTYRVELMVTPLDGYYFTSDVAVYLNNSQASYVWNGSSIILYREYDAALWAPSVTKSPTDETVKEGEMASFVAIATYTTDYEWTATSPDGKTSYNCNDLPDHFAGVTIGGDGKERMNIRNVSAELDGWKVKCTFTGPGGSAVSASATIKVQATATPSPSPTVSPKPSTSSTPSSTPAPTESSQPTSTAAPTTSGDEDTWFYDDDSHWHEDGSGIETDKSEHDYIWSTVTEATKKANGIEQGVCSQCGYSTTRTVEMPEESSGWGFLSVIFYIFMVLIILVVIGLIASIVSQNRQRKRRKTDRSQHSNGYNGRH